VPANGELEKPEQQVVFVQQEQADQQKEIAF
jgi:hypothetical protein